MRVLIFIATFIGNIFHYKNSTTYYHTIHRYSCTVPLAACYHTIHRYSCTVPLAACYHTTHRYSCTVPLAACYHTIHRYSCTVPLAACYHTIHWYSCTVPLVPVRFESNLNFLDRLSKNLRIKNFLKIRTVREELLRSDIQTDGRTERRS